MRATYLQAMRDVISMQLACNRSLPEPFELESDIRADCDVIRAEDEHREAREHMGGEVHGGGANPEGAISMQSTVNQHAISMQTAYNQYGR